MSNCVILPAPDSPAISAVQLSSTVLPSGVTIPRPVTTTRRLPFSRIAATLHPEPAVDQNDVAGDERGRVGAEESHRACDVLGIAEPTERRVASSIAAVASSGRTSVSCVFTYPGATTFARTLRLPSSRASDFVNPMIPAFEAA